MIEGDEKTSVLVVDDQPETLEVVRIPLEYAGYPVETASNGSEAWQKLESRHFDLMITDVMMPILDGLELCRMVKASPDKQDTYVIILSARAETNEKILGLENGADDYLEKPFDIAELLARVRAGERIVVAQKALAMKQKVLEEMARRDSLTGLYNRRHFEETLELEMERVLRYQRPLSVAMADVDRFKEINDLHGHMVGDLVLKEIAGIFISLTRHTDTVARYGGDEFAIILPETAAGSAQVVGNKLQQAVDAHRIQLEKSTLAMTLSLGLVSVTVAPDDWRLILEKADQALYEAKAQGRNRIIVRQVA